MSLNNENDIRAKPGYKPGYYGALVGACLIPFAGFIHSAIVQDSLASVGALVFLLMVLKAVDERRKKARAAATGTPPIKN